MEIENEFVPDADEQGLAPANDNNQHQPPPNGVDLIADDNYEENESIVSMEILGEDAVADFAEDPPLSQQLAESCPTNETVTQTNPESPPGVDQPKEKLSDTSLEKHTDNLEDELLEVESSTANIMAAIEMAAEMADQLDEAKVTSPIAEYEQLVAELHDLIVTTTQDIMVIPSSLPTAAYRRGLSTRFRLVQHRTRATEVLQRQRSKQNAEQSRHDGASAVAAATKAAREAELAAERQREEATRKEKTRLRANWFRKQQQAAGSYYSSLQFHTRHRDFFMQVVDEGRDSHDVPITIQGDLATRCAHECAYYESSEVANDPIIKAIEAGVPVDQVPLDRITPREQWLPKQVALITTGGTTSPAIQPTSAVNQPGKKQGATAVPKTATGVAKGVSTATNQRTPPPNPTTFPPSFYKLPLACRTPCLFCQELHYSHLCTKVKTLEERKAFFDKRKLCHRCAHFHENPSKHMDYHKYCKWLNCVADDHLAALCPNQLYPMGKAQIAAYFDKLRYIQAHPPKLNERPSKKE